MVYPAQVPEACLVPCHIHISNDQLTFDAINPYTSQPASAQSRTIEYNVALSSPWLQWDYVQHLERSGRLSHDPNKEPLLQLNAVFSVDDQIVRHLTSEDLSKIDLLVHWSRYSDVQVLPLNLTHQSLFEPLPSSKIPNLAKKSTGVLIPARRKDSPKTCFGPRLPEGEMKNFMDAGLEDVPWFENYLRALSKQLKIKTADKSCSDFAQFLEERDLPKLDQVAILLHFDPFMLDDYIAPTFLETLTTARNHGSLVVHFGFAEGWGSQKIRRHVRRFPRTSSASKAERVVRPLAEVSLPQWYVIPYDAFHSPEELADYLRWVVKDRTAWQWHWQGGQEQAEWFQSITHLRKDVTGSIAWPCRVCQYFRDFAFI